MRITFTGDILIYESQDRNCLQADGTRNYKPIFTQVRSLLEKADYVVGSFETTTAGENAGFTHAATSFNTPDEILPVLKWAGIDMLTTANNHCFDRGESGLRRTIDKIKETGLDYTGTRLEAKENPYLIKKIDGTKVAFLSYTYGTNSKSNGFIIPEGRDYLVNLTRPQDVPIHRPLWKRAIRKLLSYLKKSNLTRGIQEDCVSAEELTNGRNELYEKRMLDTIYEARRCSDIVIMCLHSGGQFNSKVGPYTQHLFDIIADTGIDAIICNHAHNILPVFKKNKCIIASALGNFSFAPGEGYWVDGVGAERSALFSLLIENNKVVGYDLEYCLCKKENGLSITMPSGEEIVSVSLN